MRFNLSKEKVMEFSRKNQNAMIFLYQSQIDYISARCLMLNNLFTSLIFGCQAIEKMLKAYISLEIKPKKVPRIHDLYELKNTINFSKNLNLDNFNELLQRLYGHYQSRYYDNKEIIKQSSGDELYEMDELFFYLLDNIPIPLEVKFRGFLFAHLFEKNLSIWGYRKWTILKNKALNRRIRNYEDTYLKLKVHLYGQSIVNPQ